MRTNKNCKKSWVFVVMKNFQIFDASQSEMLHFEERLLAILAATLWPKFVLKAEPLQIILSLIQQYTKFYDILHLIIV